MKAIRYLVALAAMAACLSFPRKVEVCGPIFEIPMIVPSISPDVPLQLFSEGKIGVPQPTYARSYLVVAYRYLSGTPLSAAEREAFLEYWEWRLNLNESKERDAVIKAWLTARNQRRLPTKKDISSFAALDGFEYFLNCGDDAFKTALRTLEDREKQWGKGTLNLAEWIDGQDAVFAQCSREKTALPRAPRNNAPLLLRQDRAYQSAAALFYKGDFPSATAALDAIAKDEASPWSGISEFVAIRSLFRQALLVTPENAAYDSKVMDEVKRRVQRLKTQASTKEIREAANKYEGRVQYWVDPIGRQAQLAKQLAAADGADELYDLRDYLLLLDRVHQGPYDTAGSDWLKSAPDLTQWLIVLGERGTEAPRIAAQKWQATKRLPWLYAALALSDEKSEGLEQLLSDAKSLEPANPIHVGVRYHRLRILRLLGKVEQARAEAQQLLTQKNIPPSTVNLLRRELQLMAQSPNEFASLSERNATYISVEGGLDCWWNEDCKRTVRGKAWRPDGNYLDEITAVILNREMSLDSLIDVAKLAPEPHKSRLLRAVWTRAVLLNRSDIVESMELTQSLAPLRPEQIAYTAAREAKEKRFVGILSLLRFPGLSPYVQSGFPRSEAMQKINELRDNWWCRSTWVFTAESAFEAAAISQEAPHYSIPPYLSAVSRAKAAEEWKAISAPSDTGGFLADEVIRYAKRNPGNTRVPEALHHAVRATRLSCGRDETGWRGQMSEAAFRLLHHQYPNSPWAKKTPFWYND
jgi:hypothetical protein